MRAILSSSSSFTRVFAPISMQIKNMMFCRVADKSEVSHPNAIFTVTSRVCAWTSVHRIHAFRTKPLINPNQRANLLIPPPPTSNPLIPPFLGSIRHPDRSFGTLGMGPVACCRMGEAFGKPRESRKFCQGAPGLGASLSPRKANHILSGGSPGGVGDQTITA